MLRQPVGTGAIEGGVSSSCRLSCKMMFQFASYCQKLASNLTILLSER